MQLKVNFQKKKGLISIRTYPQGTVDKNGYYYRGYDKTAKIYSSKKEAEKGKKKDFANKNYGVDEYVNKKDRVGYNDGANLGSHGRYLSETSTNNRRFNFYNDYYRPENVKAREETKKKTRKRN